MLKRLSLTKDMKKLNISDNCLKCSIISVLDTSLISILHNCVSYHKFFQNPEALIKSDLRSRIYARSCGNITVKKTSFQAKVVLRENSILLNKNCNKMSLNVKIKDEVQFSKQTSTDCVSMGSE